MKYMFLLMGVSYAFLSCKPLLSGVIMSKLDYYGSLLRFQRKRSGRSSYLKVCLLDSLGDSPETEEVRNRK